MSAAGIVTAAQQPVSRGNRLYRPTDADVGRLASTAADTESAVTLGAHEQGRPAVAWRVSVLLQTLQTKKTFSLLV